MQQSKGREACIMLVTCKHARQPILGFRSTRAECTLYALGKPCAPRREGGYCLYEVKPWLFAMAKVARAMPTCIILLVAGVIALL